MFDLIVGPSDGYGGGDYGDGCGYNGDGYGDYGGYGTSDGYGHGGYGHGGYGVYGYSSQLTEEGALCLL